MMDRMEQDDLITHASREVRVAKPMCGWRTKGVLLTAVGILAGIMFYAPFTKSMPHAGPTMASPQVVEVVEAKSEKKVCSGPAGNCKDTKCCKRPGTQCYEKTADFAMCRNECVPGLDPVDPNPTPWSCKELGKRTPGDFSFNGWDPKPAAWVHKNCSGASANCLDTGCCKNAGQACFKKNNSYAGCKHDCVDGVDPTDVDSKPWKCKQLGGMTPGHAPPAKAAGWVEKECASVNSSCAKSRCCKDPGHACFEKNASFAQCRVRCTPGIDLTDRNDWKKWTCKQLGGRTPGAHSPPHAQKLAPWVKKHCSDYHDNCASTKCCKDPTAQCYEQVPGQAKCMFKCLKDHKDFSHHKQCAKEAKGNTSETCKYDGKTWTCKKLGPRTLRPWGWPSLFCVHVFRIHSYEAGIIKSQLQKDGRFRGGIFTCDQYAVYASDTPDGTLVGDGPYGPVHTHWFQNAPVWVSEDHTAANTMLFMNFWEAVRWDLQYTCCDWTVKADPDAVMLPDRMRGALSGKMNWLNYISTCRGKLYGAVEAIQSKGLQRYFDNEGQCRGMPWQPWGEDVWISRCLNSLGVISAFDGGFVADNLCYGAYCGNGYSSAFHPFKDANSWMNCYNQAIR
jgi:hypothetical protein